MKKMGKKEITILVVSIILLVILATVTGYAVWNGSKTEKTNANMNTNTIAQNIIADTNTIENSLSTEIAQNQDEEFKELSEEEMKKEEVDPKKETDNSAKYYIKVNYRANTVTIYGKDANNQYTVPVKAMVCSTGTATPRSGVYKIKSGAKYRWHTLEGSVYGQYCTRIVGHILFHSVPYKEKYNPGSLKYNSYDKLGIAASAGCIRLTVRDALWIYNNCGTGTMVEFYSSSNPGPLGKPSAQKISGESSAVREWDPTDPDPKNPWKNYNSIKEAEEKARLEEEKRKQEEEKKKQEEEEAKKNNIKNNTVIDIGNNTVL